MTSERKDHGLYHNKNYFFMAVDFLFCCLFCFFEIKLQFHCIAGVTWR